MNILVLDEEFPWPLNTGKRIRSFNLLKRLAARHRVRYLAYGAPDSGGCRAMAENGFHPVPVPWQVPAKSGAAFYARLAANLLSPYPYSVSSHTSNTYRDALLRECRETPPDLLLAEWTPYARYLGEVSGPRKVIVAHNVETDIWRRYMENEKNPLKKWYIGVQANKMDSFERDAFTWCDGATAVSEPDARRIRGFDPRCRVEVIDNGVDLEYFHASRPRRTERPRLVFTGSMDWRPNQDAAHWFVREILPILSARRPEIEIVFVGRNPTGDILQLGRNPRVTVTGTVEDVRPYILDASVYVVPLRVGGGSRLKILEALALEMPVVSTSVGAEGLAVSPGENVLFGDDPEAFADRVERLLDDADLAAGLGRAGRKLVEERYGWDPLARKLDAFLGSIVGEASRS